LQTVASAIDTLGARYESALQHEQQLASELAHELRTPLTSIALQAHALRQTQDPAERESVARRLEQDALRAGAVLGALLSMARAGRTEMTESTQAVELCGLARRVVAEYAQPALDSGHDLGFRGDEPMVVQGHPVLLELALRNLIDNALGHTPRGTRVEVQVDAARHLLQVCDDGAEPVPADPAYNLGLGLGHRVVGKVAAVHLARFEAVDAPPGFVHAYRIQWEAPETSARP
jgi:two-component system sensor histidine kinase QseC